MTDLSALRNELLTIRTEALEVEQSCDGKTKDIHPQHRDGARNLPHYLALRQHDLRPL